MVINHRKKSANTNELPEANAEAFGCESRKNPVGNLLIPSGCRTVCSNNLYVAVETKSIINPAQFFSAHSSTTNFIYPFLCFAIVCFPKRFHTKILHALQHICFLHPSYITSQPILHWSTVKIPGELCEPRSSFSYNVIHSLLRLLNLSLVYSKSKKRALLLENFLNVFVWFSISYCHIRSPIDGSANTGYTDVLM